MTHRSGERVAAVLTFSGAMILALGSFGFFVVSVMVATGDERGEPVSVAIAGMAIGGGFLLLILAGVAGWVAINIGELREWARTVSLAAIVASVEGKLHGALIAARHAEDLLRRRAQASTWALRR
jgi:hypothetical protein